METFKLIDEIQNHLDNASVLVSKLRESFDDEKLKILENWIDTGVDIVEGYRDE